MNNRSGIILASNDYLVYTVLSDDRYKIERDGSVWTRVGRGGSLMQDKQWRKLDLKPNRNGYICINYERKKVSRARLVYAKFGKNCLEEDLVINHIDGNKLNDSIKNLELITQAENNTHRYRTLGKKPVIGNFKLTYEIAELIRKEKKSGTSQNQLAKKYGVAKSTISDIVNCKIWKNRYGA